MSDDPHDPARRRPDELRPSPPTELDPFMSLEGLAFGAGVYEEQSPEMLDGDWFITETLITRALNEAMETGDDKAAFARLPLDGFDHETFSLAAEKYRFAFQARDAATVSAAMKARDDLTRAAVAADSKHVGAEGGEQGR